MAHDSASPSSDPLQAWGLTVWVRAQSVLDGDPAKALAGKLRLKPQEIQNWFAGATLPSDPEMHARLMDALNLKEVEAARKRSLTVDEKRRVENRARIEALYATAVEAVRKKDEEDAVTLPANALNGNAFILPPAHRTAKASNRAQRSEYHDDPAVPRRMHQGGVPYEDLLPETLRRYLAGTKNAHEYLRCYRIAKDYTQSEIAEEIPAYPDLERGASRPLPRTLERIREVLIKDDDASFKHFRSLVIQNRQAIIRNAAEHESERETITHEKEHMPVIYWQEAIQHFLDPDAWGARAEIPDWEMEPIQTQGQYLRALRRALPLHAEEVADAIGKASSSVLKLEKDIHLTDGDAATRPAIVAYYERVLAEKSSGHLFDKKRLDELPIGGIEAKPRRYWLAAIRQLVDPEHRAPEGDKPYWAPYLKPITTQGEYFHAMRLALGLPPGKVAEDANMHSYTLVKIENDRNITDVSPGRRAMMNYYRNLQTQITADEEAQGIAHDERTLLFSEKRMLALPFTRQANSERLR